MTQLSTADIDAVCRLVNDLCGIYWDESKSYLIESRLGGLLARHGCAGYAELARKARAERVPGLVDDVVNAVTTNETLWFRDHSTFNVLQNNGRVAGQEVQHVHFHIIPRDQRDGLGYRWHPKSYPEGRADQLCARIKKLLAG